VVVAEVVQLLVLLVTVDLVEVAVTEVLLVQLHNRDNQILEQVLMQDFQENLRQVELVQVAVVQAKLADHVGRQLAVTV
jgi:hypothetical protein